MWGHRLWSTAGQSCRLGSLLKWVCRMGSMAVHVLWPSSLVRQDLWLCLAIRQGCEFASLPGLGYKTAPWLVWPVGRTVKSSFLNWWGHRLSSADGQSHWLGSITPYHPLIDHLRFSLCKRFPQILKSLCEQKKKARWELLHSQSLRIPMCWNLSQFSLRKPFHKIRDFS